VKFQRELGDRGVLAALVGHREPRKVSSARQSAVGVASQHLHVVSAAIPAPRTMPVTRITLSMPVQNVARGPQNVEPDLCGLEQREESLLELVLLCWILSAFFPAQPALHLGSDRYTCIGRVSPTMRSA
jgi:hypothetical protein